MHFMMQITNTRMHGNHSNIVCHVPVGKSTYESTFGGTAVISMAINAMMNVFVFNPSVTCRPYQVLAAASLEHPQKGYSHLTWFLPGIDTVARCLLAGCGVAKDLLYEPGCSAWPFQQCCPQFWQGQNFKPQPTNNRSLELYYYVRGETYQINKVSADGFPLMIPYYC